MFDTTALPTAGDLAVADIIGLGRRCVRIVEVLDAETIIVRVTGFEPDRGIQVPVGPHQLVQPDTGLRHTDGLVVFA